MILCKATQKSMKINQADMKIKQICSAKKLFLLKIFSFTNKLKPIMEPISSPRLQFMIFLVQFEILNTGSPAT